MAIPVTLPAFCTDAMSGPCLSQESTPKLVNSSGRVNRARDLLPPCEDKQSLEQLDF
jgi:hypothetical protein